MSEAVRTMASPAATWTIVVIATILALFMATAAMFMDLRVALTQRRERMLGIAPEAGDAWAMEAGSEWPRLSQALLAAAWVQQSEAAHIRSGPPTADAAGRHDIPAQRTEAGQYVTVQEAEPPTVPIPVQRAQVAQSAQEPHDAASGRPGQPADASAGETTRPDLPDQRTRESDRAERSFAGPAPQDEDEGEP